MVSIQTSGAILATFICFSSGSIEVRFLIRYKLTTERTVNQVYSSTVQLFSSSSIQLSGDIALDPMDQTTVVLGKLITSRIKLI